MSSPVAPGMRSSGPLIQAGSVLTAPTTPAKRVPVVDRTRVDPQLVKAAEGMEAMFIDYLMKTMRQTVPQNELSLRNTATEIYQGMLDTETAQTAARSGGVGLADQIIAYMLPEGYSESTGSRVNPVARTGGTDESRSK